MNLAMSFTPNRFRHLVVYILLAIHGTLHASCRVLSHWVSGVDCVHGGQHHRQASPPAAHPLPYRRVQLLGLGDEQLVQCVATDEAVLEQVVVSSLCLRLPNAAHPLRQRHQQADRYPRTITATNRVSESPSQ